MPIEIITIKKLEEKRTHSLEFKWKREKSASTLQAISNIYRER